MAKIVNKVKFQLFGRNIDDLEAMREQMVKFDPDNTGFMDPYYFQKFLTASGVFLSTQ